MPFGDVELSDLTLQPCAGVVEDDPGEPADLAHLIADRVDDVLAAKRRRNRRQVTFDLLARQLRMIGVVDLFAQVQLDEKRFDEGVIAGRKAFDVERSHPRPMLA